MTIREVIGRVKAIRQPCPADEDLIRIISQTEAEILRKIVFPRAETIEFVGYTSADLDKKLQAVSPFDELYVVGVLKYIDRTENQTTELNNNEREYNEIFGEYAAWYLRTHRPAPGPRVGSKWYGI